MTLWRVMGSLLTAARPVQGEPKMSAESLSETLERIRREPYVARIERGTHFGWWITFTKGISRIERDGGWWAFTEKRAERKARRRIARWTAQDQRRYASERTITGPSALPQDEPTPRR